MEEVLIGQELDPHTPNYPRDLPRGRVSHGPEAPRGRAPLPFLPVPLFGRQLVPCRCLRAPGPGVVVREVLDN